MHTISLGNLLPKFLKLKLIMARQFKNNLWFDTSPGLVDEYHPRGVHTFMPAEHGGSCVPKGRI